MKTGRNSYFDGGEYYCNKCNRAHHFLGDIGKKHIIFASKEIQEYALRVFKIW